MCTGLYFKCGERWGHDHVCPTSVQLHVVEELLELFGVDTIYNTDDTHEPAPGEETVMAISRPALSGGVSAKAFQLRAWIQGRKVLMLVDSSSSTSFINQTLAQYLEGVQPLPRIYKVRVDDSGELSCSSSVPRCTWYSQDQEFTTDMKVLVLGTYDAILGMDWLEAHRPMQVDWRTNYLEFSTPEGTVCLRGHDSTSTTCFVINSMQLQSMCK